MAYFVSLPQALRIAQGRLTVSFAIPPELRRMAAKGKRVLPAVTPLKRDPASMPVIASLVRDASLPRDLRTAVLFQYVTGLRIRIRINEQVKLLLKAFNITGHHRCISHAPTSAHS